MIVNVQRVLLIAICLAVWACAGTPSGSMAPSSAPKASDAPTVAWSSPTTVPTARLPASCATLETNVNVLIDMERTGPQDPGGDPVACYGDAPLTFDATWLGGGEADCPTAPEPAWLACSPFGLQAPGDTRKVGPPELFVAIHPSARPSIAFEPYAQIRVTGHFDDSAAQTCRDTRRGDAETLAPAAESIARCREEFVVTEAVAL
jgi:hypothetical protein